MRCENCGHQASSAATFCLNCGTRIGQDSVGTSAQPGGLPGRPASPTPVPGSQQAVGVAEVNAKICNRCNADNAANMKFCRQCGNSLSEDTVVEEPKPSKSAMGNTILSGPPAMVEHQPPTPSEVQHTPIIHAPTPVLSKIPSAGESTQQCPSCNGNTPTGFAFCQRCGQPLPQEQQPQESQQAQMLGAPIATKVGGAALPNSSPSGVTGIPWGRLVVISRNGEEGPSYPLAGEFVEIGSGSPATLCFQDPYLAPLHARIEKVGTGLARIVPLDRLNGVYRRIRNSAKIQSGSYLLVGRELLRFDWLEAAEAKPSQLVQHGVSRFGSPLREAWARVSLVLPNGGIRDVYYLHNDEVILGREEGDIFFREDEFLSRKHASFRRTNEGGEIADLGSANGTFLRITEAVNLSDGDVLRIGDQMFRFVPD